MIEVKYFEDAKCKYLEPIKKQSVDLFLCFCGKESCSPGYSYGPAVRSQYVLHYIVSGKGSYTINNKTYTLHENQGFLIPPDTVTYYEADKEDPWSYMWIGFNGVKAETYLNYANLNEDNVTFEYSKDDTLKNYINEMLQLKELNFSNELKLEGAKKLLAIPEVSTEEICQRLGFYDTAHLNKSFKARFGITPIQYRKAYYAESFPDFSN